MDIELKNIHKRFGPVHANNDISYTFQSGRIIGVLGENGAGKSTLMKILSGFQPADSGEIWIDGQYVDYHGPLAAISHHIGMLQQDPLDVGAFTVIENFIYGQQGGFFLDINAARQQLNQICGRFGFELDSETPINTLSIAQRQQLEIIRLLALGVKTLILDEPTTGISAEQKTLLFDTLRDLAQTDGMTILLVSHKLEDVIALCDEVFVLRAGQFVGSKDMPATKSELVTLMFGQELTLQSRERRDFSSEPVVLDIQNISLQDGRLSLENFSLEVHAGEVIGLAGLDGNGQQLIMRSGAGLMRCDDGQVLVNGQDMTGQPYRNFMAQGVVFGAAGRLEEGLIAGLTLTEHMALITERELMINRERVRALTEKQIKLYDVRGRATDNIEQLSGGNQQRVLMGLLPERPTTLILDQPTRGLDVDSARWIWEQLLAKCDTGSGLIFNSVDLDELVAYSDRIIVCYAGQTYMVDRPDQININQLGHYIGGAFEEGANEIQ